jgi:uncharacterized membrane protein
MISRHSLMNRKSLDLLLTSAIAVLIMVAALTGWAETLPIRLLSLLLVLVLPGYALTAALFTRLDLAERILYSSGLSIVLTILGGFFLNWSPWSLSTTSWAVLLSGITLVASVAAAARRLRSAPGNSQTTIELGSRQLVLLSLAAAIACGAILVARSGAIQHERASAFTQLWLLPAADANSVRVGVRSHEPATTSYRVQLTLNGAVVQEWPAIELESGGQWEMTETLPAMQPDDVVEALLYRTDAPNTVYRRGIFRLDSQS